MHEKNDTTHHDWGVFRWVAINLIDTNDDWLLRKEYIMNGYPITATIFTRYPTAVKTVDFPAAFLSTHYARGVQYSHGLGGSDGLILGNVANALNFDAITIKPRSGTYGSRQANGSYSGLYYLLPPRSILFTTHLLFCMCIASWQRRRSG